MSIATVFDTWRDRLSLRQQLAAALAVLCLVLVLGCALVAAEIARQQAAQQVETSMVSLAGTMAARLDTYMQERFRDVKDVAELEALADVWSAGPDRIRTVLGQMQDSFPDFTWIGYADAAGTVIAATKGMLEGASVAERPWFKSGLVQPVVGDVHDAKLLDSLLGSTESGEPFRFVDVAIPVRDADGNVRGVLGAHMSWSWATTIRDQLLSLVEPSTPTSIWILRSDGRALLGPEYDSTPLPAAEVARASAGEDNSFVDRSGAPILTALVQTSTDSSGLGWIVVARRPLDVAMAGVQHLTGIIFAVGVGLGAIGIVAAWFAAAGLTRPLRELTEQVDGIGRDPSVTMIGRKGGSRDLRQLSSAIRSLLRRVGSAEDAQVAAEKAAQTMQERMDERTRTLGEHISTLQQLADTDPLTRLLNRRAFLTFAGDAMNYFRRYGRDICILVIDIDFFKRINDTFGHGVGDDVIEHVGKTIQGEVRTTDKVARFGGEEFVVLLRETDLSNAAMLAERIRRHIGDGVVASRGRGDIHVTASIGLAMAQREDRDIADVIDRADRALYVAKKTGRNKVVSDVTLPAVSQAA